MLNTTSAHKLQNEFDTLESERISKTLSYYNEGITGFYDKANNLSKKIELLQKAIERNNSEINEIYKGKITEKNRTAILSRGMQTPIENVLYEFLTGLNKEEKSELNTKGGLEFVFLTNQLSTPLYTPDHCRAKITPQILKFCQDNGISATYSNFVFTPPNDAQKLTPHFQEVAKNINVYSIQNPSITSASFVANIQGATYALPGLCATTMGVQQIVDKSAAMLPSVEEPKNFIQVVSGINSITKLLLSSTNEKPDEPLPQPLQKFVQQKFELQKYPIVNLMPKTGIDCIKQGCNNSESKLSDDPKTNKFPYPPKIKNEFPHPKF